MELLNDKVTTDTLPAVEWNQVPSELQNVITQTGQALTNADLNQVGKGVAEYVANGNFYTDSGIADAYVLTGIGSKQSIQSYVNGMEVGFVPTNTNTGSSTVNVAGLGVKNIVDTGTAGIILSGVLVTLRFRSGSDDFEISNFDTHASVEDEGVQVVADPDAHNFIGDGVSVVNNANTADITIPGTIQVGGNSLAAHEGLVCSNPTVSTVDIDADAVSVRNSSGVTLRLENINLTVTISNSGANGLDTGSEAASTWYHYFTIYNPDTDTTAGLFSISPTAPTLPAGFTFFGLVGAIRNEGDSDFRNLIQVGNLVTIDDLQVLTAGSSTAPTPPATVDLSAIVPETAIKIVVNLHIDSDSGSASSEGFLFSIANVAFVAANIRNNDGSDANSEMHISTTVQIHVPQTTFYRVVQPADNLDINILGWEF